MHVDDDQLKLDGKQMPGLSVVRLPVVQLAKPATRGKANPATTPMYAGDWLAKFLLADAAPASPRR